MMKKTVVAALVFGTSVAGMGGGAVLAGEITGNGKTTPIKDRGVAASACAFSGLEDNPELEDDPANTKPGRLTQTPHMFFNDGGAPGPWGPTFPPPGTAGMACRGNN